ncbi:pyruvate dehydrogenase [Streptomyces viridochromogenes]|uniref:3-methyl-2-oxobutanoate dehydrogenase (2-methylpropanoyl-transferring) n=1 Tax=Streptomyces viridochromogenes TaxID=1938 RepID=A0A0J7Z9T1_STRVR|nr:transketolase C-terminal domain-containing protein [Streptomyces viridochromogenes]KMS72901.1 pyruvate dehydrogenase [Streptomyces viridochromogenes]KOG14648.1 pyruvate dehydrogenase [Streptomyces viridochromogenes]KOG24123.1 pyruvate dehydrogenase [Streptomyces viridochromogenes]
MSPGRPASLAETINATLADLLEHDPRVVLIGEDIGRLGGVFRVTRGLQQRFGKDRVRDSVLAESTIIGQAVGMAISGLVPVCEIQFDGFVYPAVNQLVTQAARIGHRWNGQVEPSLVVRIPSGGGVRGVEHHSESNEALFARAPGISVACPSTGDDADQILRHAMGLGSPVVMYEPIRLYWRRNLPARSTEPASAPTAARVVRRGSDVTVATFGAVTNEVLEAAQALSPDVDVEVVDLRWVAPFDLDTVLTSVARTGRLLIVHEAAKYAGIGGEVAASVAEDGFHLLKGPVRRLAPDRRAYPPADFEDDYLISVRQIMNEVLEMTK